MNAVQEQLVVEHLPLVRIIAHGVLRRCPRQVELADLVGAGTVGLVEAAQRFDPGRSLQFKTYAGWRIRGAILDALREEDPMSRPARRRARLSGETYHFEQLGLGHAETLVVDVVDDPWAECRRQLEPWIAELAPRDAAIVRRRMIEGAEVQEIAREVGLGASRVSQIIHEAVVRFQALARRS